MISMIWAMDRNRLIGRDNRMPWRLPGDLAYFRRVTAGKTVVMGRKTFESVGGKPLPGRENVIVTRNKDFKAEGCAICHSAEEALKLVSGRDVFILGGADIYSSFLPYAERLYITEIDHEFEGDTYFPDFDYSQWRLISDTSGEKNELNPYTYRFLVYERDNIKA